ncbi:4-alpha-glucanotransferase [Sinimarinibacterium sp. CAU 1509]|uniref:4-alpha-glucanotransferase n=1 Tax=Sinimarinibacterium sp. CAU 1509 TaxID=2562283 RepID=UPI0010AD2372|nr:4-alpha-glucanotransferase [Sinimarinibacterium sp. CAU 1509]TJY60949.1 4-alpha-glucanotransferase [Sinimarinibacterium sp. CAU 1509]
MAGWIRRSAGVLLHPSSLPSGRIDADAERFADWAAEAGFHIWQMLPVGALDDHGSPYQPDSAYAGNAALFDHLPLPTAAQVDAYVDANRDWLPDYALFVALQRRHGSANWTRWPDALRMRDPAALGAARDALSGDIAEVQAAQCRFDLGWAAFKRGVNARGILLFGDVPLFLAHHSADVWMHPDLFEIDADGAPGASMGVPPDAFSDEGQWWGYPPYRWDAMAAQGYRWWRRRFELQARRFDLIRIDHFRGLIAFWRIPRGAETARDGQWTPGPGRACIDVLHDALHGTQLVAEDLGYITEDVFAARKALGIPGMRVLQFAFDGDPHNPHLPANHEAETVCYTGTHDNDTTLGWWNALTEDARAYIAKVLGESRPQMPQALVRYAWSSPAPLSIVPLQDLLGLDGSARMNRPGTTGGNWSWRFDWNQFAPDLAAQLRQQLSQYGRAADAR